MMDFWDKQIRRADQLAARESGSKDLLVFYAQLLRAQKQIYEELRNRKEWRPTGRLESDIVTVNNSMNTVLETVALHGPPVLAAEAKDLLNADRPAINGTLFKYWQQHADIQFFAKAILQPYAHCLIELGVGPEGRELVGGEQTCPFCGGNPQVSFLQSKESSAESGNRNLICATCLLSWEFRRVICANCGEERPSKLGYFHSPEFDHIRIEACDSCKRYIKGVDLTRDGLAEPLVDDMYAAPLDLWAREHGYTKIELNLVGV